MQTQADILRNYREIGEAQLKEDIRIRKSNKKNDN